MFKNSAQQLLIWFENLPDLMQRLPRYRLRGLLLFSLVVATLNALIFYFEPQSNVNPVYNLYVIAGFVLLLGLTLFFNALTLTSHLFVVFCFLFLNWISWLSGGINSPNMSWMPLIAIIALMMFGTRWAVFWLLMVLAAQFGQYLAVEQGWIEGLVSPSNFSAQQALLTRLNVLLLIMVAAFLYDWMFNAKRREMSLRNAQLEATQVALLEAQTHKDEFIASVGHELRTPMNAILGLNGVLLNELRDQEQQHAIAKHIRDSTEQLLRVVNDILDISQLEAAGVSFHPTPCQLPLLVKRSTDSFQSAMTSKNLQFELVLPDHLPHWVMLDQHRFSQVLNHLLDNAVKFTNKGGITLRVTCTPPFLRFEIQDSGIGIPAQRLHNVFSRFEHADLDTHRIYGGTGLGLAICERLVTRQGGRIGLESELHVGTQVWFELPLVAADAPLIAPSELHINHAFNFKVLLVDDNPMNLLVAELMLKSTWNKVHIFKVNSGQAALDLLAQESVDIVLMDMVMPDMDGLVTTRHLREMPGLSALPVVGLTATSQSQDIAQCLAAGMDDVLMKPIDAKLLCSCIERLLQKASHA